MNDIAEKKYPDPTITVCFVPQGTSRVIKRPKTVRQLLEALDILEETALVIRDGELLTEDRHLESGQTVTVQRVVSTG